MLIADVAPSFLSAAIILDNFDAGPFSLTIPPGSAVASTTVFADPNSIIGGVRRIELNDFSTAPPHPSAEKLLGTGYMDINQAPQGVFLVLSYGNYAGSFINVNLTSGGNDRFRITLSQAPNNYALAMEVIDNAPAPGHVSLPPSPFSGPGVHEIPFSLFGPLVDFTKIGGLKRTFLSGADPIGLFRVENFEVTGVPEPRVWGFVMGIGLGLYGVYHRFMIRK